MDLHDEFRAHLASLALPGGPALVAVSGGLDSVVLLDLLHRAADQTGLELVVAHADHGIHPDSAAVAARVAALAGAPGLRCEIARLGARRRDRGDLRARGPLRLAPRAARSASAPRSSSPRTMPTIRPRPCSCVPSRGPGRAGWPECGAVSGVAGPAAAAVPPGGAGPVRAGAGASGLGRSGQQRSGAPALLDPLRPVARRSGSASRKWTRSCDGWGAHAAREREAWSRAIDLLPGLDLRVEDERNFRCCRPPRGL